MAAPKSEPLYTVDQYLSRERAAEERSEFFDGSIRAMAGETGAHGDITMNLSLLVAGQLKGTPCRARSKDTKVRSGPTPVTGRSTRGMFSYPDIVVICDEPEYHDSFRDVVLNPKVIVEVLSPSTELFDRGVKFRRYQTWNPTLAEYVLVAQDEPRVEVYTRQADGSWRYHVYAGLEATLTLSSIACTLKLVDVYDRVVLVGEESGEE